MRTKEIEIAGGRHLLVFNNRVLARMEEKGIKLDDLREGEKPVTNVLELLIMMSEAGARYAKLEHLGDYEPIDRDALMDTTGPDDYSRIQIAISEAMSGTRNVEAGPGKNAESGPEEARGN